MTTVNEKLLYLSLDVKYMVHILPRKQWRYLMVFLDRLKHAKNNRSTRGTSVFRATNFEMH